jgi:dethiobiotin synthetase
MSANDAPPLPPALRQSLFIAGTDTGIGKTTFAVWLLRRLAAEGIRAAGMKPVAAGAIATPDGLRNEDALALLGASGVPLPYKWVNPWCLERPTSPHLAAVDAGINIEMAPIQQAYDSIRQNSELIIIEGAGGWLTPVGPATSPGESGPTMQDIACTLGLPVVLVVGIRLGALNHALLTAEVITRSGLPLAGWVASLIDPAFTDAERYVESLQQRLPAPLLWSLRAS